MKGAALFPIKLQNLSVPLVCAAFACTQMLAVAALMAKDPRLLVLLTTINAAGLVAVSAGFRPLLRFFLIQSLTISILYFLRYGPDQVPEGLRVSWKLSLAYSPFVILSAAVSSAGIVRAFSRFLPPMTAFTLGACLRFFPYFLNEMQEIYAVQRMRGACLSLRDAWKPRFWRDLLSCLMIPALAQGFFFAHCAALAVKARRAFEDPPLPTRRL
jgi:energy-coupling factor transport system permease protein